MLGDWENLRTYELAMSLSPRKVILTLWFKHLDDVYYAYTGISVTTHVNDYSIDKPYLGYKSNVIYPIATCSQGVHLRVLFQNHPL